MPRAGSLLHDEANVRAAASSQGFATKLKVGRNGLLLLLAVLLFILWYALSGPSTHIR